MKITSRQIMLLLIFLALISVFILMGRDTKQPVETRDIRSTEAAPAVVFGAKDALYDLTTTTTAPTTTTTIPPTTTTTYYHPPSTTTTAPPVTEAPVRNTSVNWDAIAECESGGNWSINTGNGYYGGLQFTLETWRGTGGTGYPHEHSREEQIHRAEILYSSRGLSPWPNCGKYG
jgi:hypothetical protein